MVNWNTRELMRESLRSIDAATRTRPLEVIVVDNGSEDGSVEMVAQEFPHVVVWRSDRNLGFAKGCNAGIRLSRGRYVLLINTDTVVRDYAIDKMLAYMEAHPDVGVVGPKLVYADGRPQRSAAGAFPSLRSAFNSFFFLTDIFPRHKAFEGLFLGAMPDQASDVDWVSSAVMLFRRQALEAIGGVPEDYPCYMEDAVCCLRLRRHNWKVMLLPEAEVVHHKGGASRVLLRPAGHNAWRSLSTYFYRQFGLLRTLVLQAIAISGFCLRVLALGLAIVFLRKPALRANWVQSFNLLMMAVWLSWEMITGRDWRKESELLSQPAAPDPSRFSS